MASELTVQDFSAQRVHDFIADRHRQWMAAEAEAAEHAKAQREELRKAFETKEVPTDALERVFMLVRGAVERGDKDALVLQFPCDFLADGGRAINSGSKDWSEHLNGFAARAFHFYETDLKPRGFELSAAVIDFPGGKPGNIGFFLRW
jgi:hypothetical protein